MIGCDCRICTSSDPRDKRLRPSALIEFDDKHVLIDTSPELRLQCLANRVSRVDAVLYTHAHADHVTGLDDLRRFNGPVHAPLSCYGTKDTLSQLRRMFPYAWSHDPAYPSTKPHLCPTEVDGPFDLFGHRITPVPLVHGDVCVLGYRVRDVAYCTDCNDIPPASQDLLRDLDVLVLDALRFRPHPTHMTLDQAIAWARRIGAKRTIFTHIAHEIMHQEVQATLPGRIELAYDGLMVEVE